VGISTLRDRVCMTAAMLVLEPIFEADPRNVVPLVGRLRLDDRVFAGAWLKRVSQIGPLNRVVRLASIVMLNGYTRSIGADHFAGDARERPAAAFCRSQCDMLLLPDGLYPFIDQRLPLAELTMVEAPPDLQALFKSQAAANGTRIVRDRWLSCLRSPRM
jgi:hypothetical protein